MTALPTSHREIPVSLQQSMAAFRSSARKRKLLEVLLLATLGLLVSWLAVFGLDRVIDTPSWLRAVLLVAGAVGFGLLLPVQAWRWVWGTRRFDQVARVVARKDAATGDRLLGVIDLAGNDQEFGRSPVLCAAAIAQVDSDMQGRDASASLPDSRHRGLAKVVVAPLAAAAAMFAVFPDAAGNAAKRWLAPFGDTARFTFARVQTLPATMVVAKGEPADFVVELRADSDWRPDQATVRTDAQAELTAARAERSYVFHLPALTKAEVLTVAVGDFRHDIEVQPLDRPAINTLDAQVALPEYLGILQPRTLDGRAGVLGVVKGSRVGLVASTTRELQSVTVNRQTLEVAGREFRVPAVLVDAQQDLVLDWTDVHGLHGKPPMTVTVRAREDETPTVYTEGLRNETVLLVSDTLQFQVHGHDDFGVRRVGLSWATIPDALTNPEVKKGEKLLLAAENGEQEKLQVAAAFCPELLGIPAQPLQLSAWVEDACPGHARVLSTPMTIFVMTPEQHMIWLTKQLTVWDDEAREVHERELALYDENLSLRALAAEDLDRPANRRRIETQARSERANGQRLSSLVTSGQSLLAQAARNPEFNATSLDQWAEMMRALQDIAASRMPSVANLLAAAASSRSTPTAGINRTGPRGGQSPALVNVNRLPGNPAVVDAESTMMNDPGTAGKPPSGGKVNQAPAPLRLAQTTLQGKTGGGSCPPGGDDANKVDTMTDEELAKAIEEQRKLLEEFARLQGDISKVLAALTGSTFVKRFKAESREQGSITGFLRTDLLEAFGQRKTQPTGDGKQADTVIGRENRSSNEVSVIQDDLGAFVDRLTGQPDQKKFKTVLDEMRETSPSAELADLGNDVKANLKGDALVGTEFWSDKLDYWAELLVGPG